MYPHGTHLRVRSPQKITIYQDSSSVQKTPIIPFNAAWFFRNPHFTDDNPQYIGQHNPLTIGSMYGIYANIWGILMVNLTIYSIHGSYGIVDLPIKNRGSFHSYVNVCQRVSYGKSSFFIGKSSCLPSINIYK